MAFQTGVSTSIDNLMSLLFTFATANGWVQDDFTSGDPGKASLHKNNVYVHFQWTDATDGGTLAIYQSLGYIGAGTNKWQHTDDSGSGTPSASASNFDNGRNVNIFAGPHTAYWFFENDSSPAYIHVVVEVNTGRFRHFGFGELNKIGDWTGGEYAYGLYWNQTSSRIDVPGSPTHTVGLDHLGTNGARYLSTVHLEGFPNSVDPSSKWAATGRGSVGSDRGGTGRNRLSGGWRAGPQVGPLSYFPVSLLNAFKALIPIDLYWRNTSLNPDDLRLIGSQPDIAHINMASIEPGQTFTVGTDTWYVFPMVRKLFAASETEESYNAGVAYRQVTA